MTATPNTAAMRYLLDRVEAGGDPIMGRFQFGAGGKILDGDGRLICTMNLQDLKLGEAFTYAAYFMASLDMANHLRALIAAPVTENEGGV